MENDSRNGSNKGVCEKIFSFLCPNFQTNHHGCQKHDSNPAAAEATPTGMTGMPKAEMRVELQVKKDNKASGLDNDAFSDYIIRTKIKIRAMPSNVGIAKVASREYDDVYETKQEDTFTDFVKRSKFKIRKTSSIGSRMNISFEK